MKRWLLRIAAADVRAGKSLSAEDRARVQVARRRLAAARGGSGLSGVATPDGDPFDPEILGQEADRESGELSDVDGAAIRALDGGEPRAVTEAPAPARRTRPTGAGGRSDDDLPV